MKVRMVVLVVIAALVAPLALTIGAQAARPPNPGAGRRDGGGGGGSDGGTATPDLGDLFVLYRDADGVPILTPDFCQQPLAPPGSWPDCPTAPSGECIVPVDPATCAVLPDYVNDTQEVDFGRLSVVRSPASVLDSQLDDAIVNLSTADCLSLDPAGRLVTSTVAESVVTSAPIDSPLQSLAIYRQLMLTGSVGGTTDPLALPGTPLDTAARAFGTASDKTIKVTVDAVAYTNQILGLTDQTVPTYLPKKCIDVKEEVQGVVQMVPKCFLLYSGYSYSRDANFQTLPAPAYIPAGNPQPGWFEYMGVYSQTPLLFQIVQGPIATTVFGSDPGFLGGNIGGFTQAADDTRAVINFMHSNPVPLGYETPLSCQASGKTHYDVSISPESGLQVPVRMVAGTEGREFTLAVANAGPDSATGVVVLSAVDSSGNPIPTFPRTFGFTLAAGTSQSWTEGFTINYATTITWTATASAEYDVNTANNSVTATTTVTKARGRSGR